MPELPEVECVRRRLDADLQGECLGRVEPLFPGVFSIPDPTKRPLLPARYESAGRKGKMLCLRFESDQFLLVHLRMTGRFSFHWDRSNLPPHTHVLLHFKSGRLLAYSDPRRFGRLLWRIGESLESIPELAALGPDALDIPRDFFISALKSRHRVIKPLLLDQKIFSGLGNIYVDEALFLARIHPLRSADSFSTRKLGLLWESLDRVLRDAIDRGGSTIRDFADSSGTAGEYQKMHQVYGRAGEPCHVCGAKLKRLLVAQRGTVFCPRCQPSR